MNGDINQIFANHDNLNISLSHNNLVNPANILDAIAKSHHSIQVAEKNPHLVDTMEKKLSLQKTMGDYALNSTLMSKIIATIIKSIDSLVHIQ